MSQTNLSKYNNSWYNPGAGKLKQVLWHFVNHLFFTHGLLPVSGVKVALLKAFGANIGTGVNIKPCVNIKYPWLLSIGDYSWIGEEVWIDNLTNISIGANCCISQGAMLLTGNHDFKKITFDLIVKGITLEDGAWVGAKAVVCPGVTCGSHSILAVGSIATQDLLPYTLYQGNPAVEIKKRNINSE